MRKRKSGIGRAVLLVLSLVLLCGVLVFRISRGSQDIKTDIEMQPESVSENAQSGDSAPIPQETGEEETALSEEENTLSAEETALPEMTSQPEVQGTPEPVVIDYTGAVRISEIMTKNRSTQLPDLPEYYDWIELENVSDSAINIQGWTLEQTESSLEFPNLELQAGELVLYPVSSGKYLTDDDTLTLKDDSGGTVCSITVPKLGKNEVYRLSESGEYEISYYPTPGFENSKEGYCEYQTTLAPVSGLMISEVVVYNKSGLHVTLDGCDWVELYNASAEAINLSEYSVSDSNDPETSFTLPDYNLQPGAYYLFLCTDKENYTNSKYSVVPVSLSAENETLFLFHSGVLADAVTLNDIPLGASYGRKTDSAGFWYFEETTPNQENAEGYRCISDAPTFSVAGGQYSSPVTVELSGNGKIYYTLDSSAPTVSSTVYTGPIEIKSDTVIRAVCVEDGQMPSSSVTENFVLDTEHTLPLLCINADAPSELIGLWKYGDKITQIPGNVSYYDGTEGFTINCSLAMTGGTSLSGDTQLCKKNIIFRFKSAYGPSTLNYSLFDSGTDEFSSLLVRAGQDYYNTVVSNELCQTLCAEFTDDVLTQRGKWVVLYINGKYYGIYALKENDDIMLYANRYGVDPDSVIQETASIQESSPLYKPMEYIFSHDMSDENNYQYLCDNLIDINSLIDWVVLEGWSANPDLLHGNLKYACSTEDDGKVRLVFYDLDAALARFGYCFSYLFSPPTGQESQIYALLLRLIRNRTFKDQLCTRLAEGLRGALSDENVVSLLDEMTEEIDGEMQIDGPWWQANPYDNWKSQVSLLRENMSTYHVLVINKFSSLIGLSNEEINYYFGDLLA